MSIIQRLVRPIRPTRTVLAVERLEERAVPATFYLSPAGSNTAGGTLQAPWQTLAHALTRAQGGDTLVLRAGTYTGGVTVNVPNLTIRSHDGEQAHVTASNTDAAVQNTIRFNVGAGGGVLRNLEVSGGYFYSVKTESGGGSGQPWVGTAGLLVEDCKLHDSGRDVVKITPGATDIVVRRCEIYNSGRRDPSNAEGIDNVNGDRMVVQDNYIHDIATNGVYAKGGAADCVIERNRVERCGAGGILLGFYTDAEFFDASNTQYYESINSVVRNNVITATMFAGLGLYGALNPKLYNNTLVGVATSGQAAVLLSQGEVYVTGTDIRYPTNQGVSIANNVVTLPTGSSRPLFQVRVGGLTGAADLGNNRYYRPGGAGVFSDQRTGSSYSGGLAGWKTHIGGDAGSTEGDPGLTVDGHLTAGSLCVNAGRAVTGVAVDIDGQARPQGAGYDIGADELPAATPPQVTAFRVHDGTVQRSMVTSLAVTFSAPVTVGSGAFVLTSQAGGASVPLSVSTAVVGGVTVATLTFPGATGGSLADGNWVLRTVASAVRDSSGAAMTADRTDAFYRLFGDATGDRGVDALDFFHFRGTFGLAAGQPGFRPEFDADGDGLVDNLDFLNLRQRFGQTLPP